MLMEKEESERQVGAAREVEERDRRERERVVGAAEGGGKVVEKRGGLGRGRGRGLGGGRRGSVGVGRRGSARGGMGRA